MNPQPKFAYALPMGTTPFLWLIAGEQAHNAVNDKDFNEVTLSEKEQQL